jgi:PKD repeat protein
LEKHAVAKMTFESGGFGALCSGALINNTKNNGTPYFLTAQHCISTETEAQSLVTYFNYEKSDCNSGVPVTRTLSGSSLKADDGPSDFALLLLDETPPGSYQPYYAGWNALSDDMVEMGTGVHHPGGDVKKVSVDYNQIISFPQTGTWDDGSETPPDSHWLVIFDKGNTEGGSSGSPLFDENNRIVGQLHGSVEEIYKFYGKLSRSWTSGNFSFQQLKAWLDPDNTGTLIHDGYFPSDNVVDAHPYADFQNVCTGTPLQLSDGSLFAPETWTWSFSPASMNFTDGTNSSSQNPVVIFQEDTLYTVTLGVTNAISSDQQTRKNYIKAKNELLPEMRITSGNELCYEDFDSIYCFAQGADDFEWMLVGNREYILVDSSALQDDILLLYRNDTVTVDSNFTVRINLIGIHGSCSDTITNSITFYYPFNDDIENAYPVSLGLNGPFNNFCATVQPNESNPPEGSCNSQETWCGCEVSDIIIDNSVWFTFTGPESGIIAIDAPGFDNQIAIYDAGEAADIISGDDSKYTILAANDDYFGEEQDYSALIKGAIVEPDKLYWIQVDGSACGATGEFYMELFDHNLALGIDDNELDDHTDKDKLFVYPNPASDHIFIENIPSSGNIVVKFTSLNGSKLFSQSDHVISRPGEKIKMDIPGGLSDGLYLLQVISSENIYQSTVSILSGN